MYEDMCWNLLSRALYRIYQKTTPGSQERQEACSAQICELKAQLDEELHEAREAIAAEKHNSSTFNQIKHRHRHFVAGYHQMWELMQQGEQAIQAAMEDEVIIFQGHMYVLHSIALTCSQLILLVPLG